MVGEVVLRVAGRLKCLKYCDVPTGCGTNVQRGRLEEEIGQTERAVTELGFLGFYCQLC